MLSKKTGATTNDFITGIKGEPSMNISTMNKDVTKDNNTISPKRGMHE